LSSICLHKGITNKLKCKVDFFIKETTSGSKKKIYGPYKGTFKKYEKPVIVELKDGRKIKHTIYPSVYKLKNKVTMQKGGNNIQERLENLVMNKTSSENEIIKIIDTHDDLKYYSYALFVLCLFNNKLVVAKSLIDNGHIDINKEYSGNILLIKYCRSDYGEERILNIVKFLLNNGANVNIQNKHGKTALHEAVFFRKNKIIELLLENLADVNIKDNDGNTVLHISTKFKTIGIEIVNLILNKGSYINIKDNKGNTALHIAVIFNRTERIKLLLEKGADVNIKNDEGKTALNMAIEKEDKKIAELFLDYAIIQKDTKLVKSLIENGVNINTTNTGSKEIKRILSIKINQRNLNIKKLLVNKILKT